MHVHDHQTKTGGFVMAADDGQALWFLNTLTINKVGSGDSQGQLSIVDHRVPPGFAPPPHIHEASDEAGRREWPRLNAPFASPGRRLAELARLNPDTAARAAPDDTLQGSAEPPRRARIARAARH
jgi:hypothetical protein